MTSMKFPIYNFNFILILTLILWTRLGKRELLDRAIYFNLNIEVWLRLKSRAASSYREFRSQASECSVAHLNIYRDGLPKAVVEFWLVTWFEREIVLLYIKYVVEC